MMANKENLPPKLATTPPISGLSPNHKPALNRQRDHSACRRPETPLKVRKTRENLKQLSLYADIPPPCVHAIHSPDAHCSNEDTDTSSSVAKLAVPAQAKEFGPTLRQSRFEEDAGATQSTSDGILPRDPHVQRQKSVSRRMLSRMKQGISGRKISPSISYMGSEASLVRRLSGRRNLDRNEDRRAQSFEVVRPSIDSGIDETPDSVSFASGSGQRSFTDSTVSTAEVLGDSADPITPGHDMASPQDSWTNGLTTASSQPHHSPSSPSPQPTPRPPPPRKDLPLNSHSREDLSLTVPCVDLYVTMDTDTVDVHSKRDIWIAVEATVKSTITRIDQGQTPTSLTSGTDHDTADLARRAAAHSSSPGTACGAITTLRLCFKAVQGCLLRDVIGQKSVKDLAIGQKCSLFIKLRIPKVRMLDSTIDLDQESLFTELESMIGTLRTEVLHVEARYRHSMLPTDNVVTVRQVCKIKRPKTESRWSVADSGSERGAPAEVHGMLARYVISHYSSDKALELLEQYLEPQALAESGVREICESLHEEQKHQQQTDSSACDKPSVVITDIDLNNAESVAAAPDHYSIAPNSPTIANGLSQPTSDSTFSHSQLMKTSPIHATNVKLAPPLLSGPSMTAAISMSISSSDEQHTAATEHTDSQDSAKQLWRHIRRSSLTTKQLQDMVPERLIQLEADDEHLRELRRKALANKRSIGAETLRAWKWEESMQQHDRSGEAPWM